MSTDISALPQTVNLNLYAANDTTTTLTVLNGDGTPADLAGVTVLAQIRDPAGELAATLAPAVAANVITLTLAHAAAAALPSTAAWDCQLTYPAGTVLTLCAGAVNVRAKVSSLP